MIRDRGCFGTFYGPATCLAVPYPSGGGEVFLYCSRAGCTPSDPSTGPGAQEGSSSPGSFFFGRRQ
jgi:hypothetical protein